MLLALQNVGGDVDKLIYNYSDFSYDESKPAEPEEGCDKEYWMDLLGPDNDFDQTVNRENMLYRKAAYGEVESRYYPSEDWKDIFDKEHESIGLFLIDNVHFIENNNQFFVSQIGNQCRGQFIILLSKTCCIKNPHDNFCFFYFVVSTNSIIGYIAESIK